MKATFEEGIAPLWDQETCLEIGNLLGKRNGGFLEDEIFMIETGSNRVQVQLRVTLAKKDGSWSYPVECIAFLEGDNKGKSSSDIGELLVDWMDLYWQTYLSEKRVVYLPLNWDTREFEDITFLVRGFPRNLEMEKQADSFLEKHGYGHVEILPISNDS